MYIQSDQNHKANTKNTTRPISEMEHSKRMRVYNDKLTNWDNLE